LPLLEKEKHLFYVDQPRADAPDMSQYKATIRMVVNPKCDHFSLKPSYFRIRLERMLHEENGKSRDDDSTSDKIEKLESDLLAKDEQDSKDIERSLAGDGRMSKAEPATAKVAAGTGIRWLALIIGTLFGCLGTIYKKEVGSFSLQFYTNVRLRLHGSRSNDDSTMLSLDEDQ